MTQVKVFLFLLCLTAVGTLLRIYTPQYFSWLKVPHWAHNSTIAIKKAWPPFPLPDSPANTQRNATKKPRLCSCQKCLTEDQELDKLRLDTFVDPIFSEKYKLSEDNFYWWRRIQGEKSDYNTFQNTQRSLFQLFPPVPDLIQPNPDKCRTCAVVGNSPRLRGSEYGSIIDTQQVVIRLNRGPIKGFEKDVGTKTTHRAMYPESATNLDGSTHLLLFAFKMLDLQWLIKAFTTGFTGRSYAPVMSKINANKSLVMVVNPAFMRYVHDQWLNRMGSYPSTGIMTVLLALHICDEVHVFGFGADTRGYWSHYWEPRSNTKVNGIHPGSYEFSVLEQLDKQERLTFYKGL